MSLLAAWVHLARERLRRGPVLRAIVAMTALSIVVGVALDFAGRTRWPAIRARALAESGHPSEADAIAWRALKAHPDDVELLFFFVTNHRQPHALALSPEHEMRPVPMPKATSDARWVDDDAVDALLEDPRVPRKAAVLARYVLDGGEDPALEALVRAWATQDPPVPWANRLLGHAALMSGDERGAASFLEREGLFVPAHVDDVDASLQLRLATGDVEGARARLRDPAVGRLASARTKFDVAIASRDFRRAFGLSFGAFYERPALGPLLLAAIAALAWLAVCVRIGKVRERPGFRVPLYAAAFVLGVASIWPTLWLIHLQEIFLHLQPTGEPVRDAIFYVFGVGFREELSKLACFALLWPLLRKRATSLDVLVAGGIVGLGFAAEENVQYLAHGDLGTALARYLTANFLHMSMTGLAASALWEGASDPERRAFDASTTILVVIGLHGAYDFLLGLGDASFAAMVVFIILARRFLEALWRAQGRPLPGVRTEVVFGIGTAAVVAASFVWGAARVGAGIAAEAMIGGLLGLVIIVIVFARTLARM